MSVFKLEKRHLNNGLNDEDFSKYARFRVVSCHLNELPHWDTLLQNHKLTAATETMRATAVAQWIKSIKFPSLTLEQTINLAASPHAITLYRLTPIIGGLRREKYFRENMPNLIRTQNMLAPTNSGQKEKLPWLFPFGFRENYPIHQMDAPREAIVLRSPPVEYRRSISLLTEIQCDRIKERPNEGLLPLFHDFHEAAHLEQAHMRSHWAVPAYYSEMSADLNSYQAFKNANVGSTTCEQHRFTRYIQLLHAPEEYWIALALDALQKNRTPPTFWQVHAATMEMRFRLAMRMLGKPHKHINGFSFQKELTTALQMNPKITLPIRLTANEQVVIDDNFNKSFRASITTVLRNEPEIIFTILRQMRDANIFIEPLSRGLVSKVIEAAEYFGGNELTHDLRAHQKVQKYTQPLCTLVHA